MLHVKHQQRAINQLARALARDCVPHAYAFHGPMGVGRQTLARALAGALLCPDTRRVPPEGAVSELTVRVPQACGVCPDCRLVAGDNHGDLHVVHRRLNKFHPDATIRARKAIDLGVDIVRQFLVDAVAAKPARGRAKVFIVTEAERMTPAAQNALLKTLEEPPPTTIIILIVDSLDALLETTVSRCQPVAFDRLPADFIAQRLALARPDLPADQVRWIARFADGSLGRALECAEESLFALNDRIAPGVWALPRRTEALSYAAWSDAAKALGPLYKRRDEDISDTEAQRRGFKTLMALAAAALADVARDGSGTDRGIVNAHAASQLKTAGRALSPRVAADLITRLARTEAQLDLNANVQLCIETLIDDLVAGATT